MEPLWLLPSAVYALGVLGLAAVLGRPGPRGRGYTRGPEAEPPSGLSVILACRNEEQLLPATLACLRCQDLPAARLQLIAVDDGSTDHTGDLLAAEAGRPGPELVVLATSEGARGKKRAITAALARAEHPVIAVLDGDTAVGPRWASTLLAAFGPDTGLVAGPALLAPRPHRPLDPANRRPFARLVRLEYCGLLGAGLASFALGRPLFACGTNLAWRRRAFEQCGGFEGLEHLPSGDDTLLIQRISTRTDWTLQALWAAEARVWTRGPADWKALLAQRARWVSTGGDYPDRLALLAGLGVYGVFLACVVLPGLALAGIVPPALAVSALLLKFLPDALLAARAAGRMGQARLLVWFPLAWLAQLGWGLLLPWIARRSLRLWRVP